MSPASLTLVGFDSSWTDHPRACGAICALAMAGGKTAFHPPRLASFAEALDFIRALAPRDGATLVAIDQSIIVPNSTGARPVERAAGSLIGWLGGGVQPSNRNRRGMFCDDAPIWRFLRDLDADMRPEEARIASSGRHVIEVFPALALPSLDPGFLGRLAAPRYNPARCKTFRHADWVRVAGVIARHFDAFGLARPAAWCRDAALLERPRKADQDRLDAMICLLTALWWRRQNCSRSVMLGDLDSGYVVAPATPDVRHRLEQAALRQDIGAR